MSEFKVKDVFEISIGGQPVKVEYDGIFYEIVLRFSFYGKTISSTGFKSYFLFTQEYISMGYIDYKICAKEIADSLYKDLKTEMIKNGESMDQLTLF